MDSSQNPFLRLKRYQISGHDPKENHATEVLAACLDLSLTFRSKFLKLLGEGGLAPEEVESWEIHTQVNIPAGPDGAGQSYWDLMLEKPEKGRVVVEVKVWAPLTNQQIEKYLSDLGAGNGKLFVLVREPNNVPAGFKNFITWRRVAELCQSGGVGLSGYLESTDDRIAARLFQYLEQEGIIMNFDSKDLLGFAAGVRAESAFETLANECTNRVLEDKTLNLDQRRFEQKYSANNFPRLTYSSKLLSLDLHVRAAGLGGWNAGHTLALSVKGPAGRVRELAEQFQKREGWQAWIQDATKRWKAIGATEEIPAIILGSVAYKPLLAEGDPPKGHMKALRNWEAMPWADLVSIASGSLIDAIKEIQGVEAELLAEGSPAARQGPGS